MIRQRTNVALLALMCLLGQACGAKRVPIVVGQSGLAVTQAIGAIQNATKQLTDAKTLTPAQALAVQTALLSINDKVRPLPDLLRTIDRLEAAGSSTTAPVDQAIAILDVVGQDLSVVIAGVPISETTQQLIALVRAAHATVHATIVEVAKLKGANQ